MKVYIGPYVDNCRSSIHRNYMNKKHGFVDWPDVENYTVFEKFTSDLEDALNWIYNHTVNLYLDKRKRKIKVRIDNYDIWSMDHTFALIALPMLKKLKENKHGHPFVDDTDAPEKMSSNKAPPHGEWDWDDNNSKRWDWVLDEMIHAFECSVNEDWEDQFYSGEVDFDFEKTENNLKRLMYGPNHTFKVDREGMKAAWDRRNNAMRLFGKYYNSLWD